MKNWKEMYSIKKENLSLDFSKDNVFKVIEHICMMHNLRISNNFNL